MSKYIVNLQVAANFTATVEAEDEDQAYELAQDLAAEVAERHLVGRNDSGTVVLAIERDDINNPMSEDIQASYAELKRWPC